MKNNHGQVLVLFILLLPIFLLLLAIVIDLGLLYYEDKKLENTVKESVSYGLKHQSDVDIEEKIKNLAHKNIDSIKDITIYQEENYIQVTVVEKYKGLFPYLFKNNIYEIENTYYGYLSEGKTVINKE